MQTLQTLSIILTAGALSALGITFRRYWNRQSGIVRKHKVKSPLERGFSAIFGIGVGALAFLLVLIQDPSSWYDVLFLPLLPLIGIFGDGRQRHTQQAQAKDFLSFAAFTAVALFLSLPLVDGEEVFLLTRAYDWWGAIVGTLLIIPAFAKRREEIYRYQLKTR